MSPNNRSGIIPYNISSFPGFLHSLRRCSWSRCFLPGEVGWFRQRFRGLFAVAPFFARKSFILLNSHPKIFCIFTPPYPFGCLLSRFDRLIFSISVVLFLGFVSPDLFHRPGVGLIHPRGMLSLVGSGRLFRKCRDFRNHSLRHLSRLLRFRSRIRFFGFG